MPTNKKTTWKQVSKIASKQMKSPKAIDRSIAASDLVQVKPNKETSRKIGTEASRVLSNPASTKKEKEVAGSVLSQVRWIKKKPAKKGKK